MTSPSKVKVLSPEEQRKLEIEVGLASQKAADKFDKETKLPRMRFEVLTDVKTIEYLGAGAFNQVYKVKTIHGLAARKGLKGAIKNDRRTFLDGATDLVQEAKLLNALSHPHILALQGVSTSNWADSYLKGESFCLYLDRLAGGGSVFERFELWKATKHAVLNRDMFKRLETIALPIAKAMEYLHERNIIFRDIKPANMGFDVNGIVKLYDFGLAREIIDPTEQLEGRTGTLLYMAPEVALSQKYGLSADVYSYAIFLCECCTLQRPLEDVICRGNEQFEAMVFKGHHRPELHPDIFTSNLTILLTKAWAKAASARPTMKQIVKDLDEAIVEIDTTLGEKSWFPTWNSVLGGTNPAAIAVRKTKSAGHKLFRTRSTDSNASSVHTTQSAMEPRIKIKPKPKSRPTLSRSRFTR